MEVGCFVALMTSLVIVDLVLVSFGFAAAVVVVAAAVVAVVMLLLLQC